MPNPYIPGRLTTNPSLEWIAYEDADHQYLPPNYNCPTVPRVRFSFRFDEFPTPAEVEVDGDLAIEVMENLGRGDRYTLYLGGITGGNPIRPDGIIYDPKVTPRFPSDQRQAFIQIAGVS